MALLIAAFLFMALVTFGIIMVALRPSSEQKALDKRLTRIKATPGQIGADPTGLLLASREDGSFAWIEGLVERFKFSERLQKLLIQADTKMTLGKLLAVSGGIGVVVFIGVYLFVTTWWLALAAGVPSVFLPVLYLRMRRNRRVAAFNGGLADSIDMMSRSLRAGHSVVASIGIIAEQATEPLRGEFNEVFKQQNYGLPLRDALMQLLDRVPSQDLRVLVTGMLVQKETGGNLAEILDRITFVIRERLRIQGEIRTHTAQGRLTGWILCLLPIIMLILINWINPGYSEVLFKEPTGQKLLGLGVALLCIGGFIIRAIINGIEV